MNRLEPLSCFEIKAKGVALTNGGKSENLVGLHLLSIREPMFLPESGMKGSELTAVKPCC